MHRNFWPASLVRIFLLGTLLYLFPFSLMKGQNETIEKEEKVLKLAQRLGSSTDPEEQMHIYGEMAAYFLYKDAAKSLDYAEKASDLALQEGHTQEEAYYLKLLGSAQVIKGDFSASIKAFNRGLNLPITVYDTTLVGLHTGLGLAHQYLYEYELALNHYYQAIQITENHQLPAASISPLGCIASLHAQRGEFHKAIPSAKEALKLSVDLKEVKYEAYAYRDLAYLYLHLGNLDSAFSCAERAIFLAETKHDYPFIACNTYIYLSEIYRKTTQYPSALKAAETARSMAEDIHARKNLIQAEHALASIYREMFQPEEAIIHAHKALETAREGNYKQDQRDIYLFLADIYHSLKQDDYAYKYLSSANELTSELQKQKQEAYRSFAELRYEAQEREAENRFLKSESSRNREQLQKSKSFGVAMTLFSLLVLLVLLIVYQARRNNQNLAVFSMAFSLSEKQIRLKFVQRMVLAAFLMTLPVMIYLILWGTFLAIAQELAMELMLLVLFLLARRERLAAIFWISLFFFHTISALIPVFFGHLQFGGLASVTAFLVLSYLSHKPLHQIMNSLFLVLGFWGQYYLGLLYPGPLVAYPFALEMMVSMICFLTIIITLLYVNQFINDSREELSHSNRFLKQIADLNPHFIFAKDRQRALTFTNAAMADTYGFSTQGLIGKKDEEIQPNFDTDSHFKEDDLQVLGSGKAIYRKTEKIITATGMEKWLETTKIPLFDAKNQISGLLGVASDITDRVHAEEALKEREATLHAIINSIPDAILAMDLQGRPMFFNTKILSNFQEKFGQSLYSEIKWSETFSPETITKYSSVLKRVREGETAFESISLGLPTGLLHLDVTFAPVSNSTGETIGVLVIGKDVSQLKKQEADLRASQMNYQNLFQSLFDGVMIYDFKEEKILSCNPAAVNLFGFEQEEGLINKHRYDLFPEFHAEFPGVNIHEKSDEHKRAIFNKETVHVECVFLKKDGSFLFAEASIYPLADHDFSGILVVKDISEQRNQQNIITQQIEDLNKKNEELKLYIESNMNLENFAYLASHDLKAPIRTIISFAQLLERRLSKKLNQDEKEFLDFIISASANMQRLVNDLLSYSRVNTDKIQLEDLEVKPLLDEIMRELGQPIREKSAMVEYHDLPEIIKADRVKMRQLIQNLMTNALKFHQSSAKPFIQIFGRETQNAWFIAVKDNGIGIQEEYQEQIFQIFRRLHSEAKYEGSGIGLAMCKKIVEQHFGEIGVHSEYGSGSEFFFSIPKTIPLN